MAIALPGSFAKSQKYGKWDEDTTPFRPHLYLDAGTYKCEKVFDTNPTQWDDSRGYEISPAKNFAYQNRILSQGDRLRIFGNQEGCVEWNGDVVIPMLLDMSRMARTGERFAPGTPDLERAKYGSVWMSLTPMEMLSQRIGVRMASGTVVIGGLGLGWFLKKVCEKAEVKRVIVVEKSSELLDWYGYQLCSQFPKVCDVVCDDIYNQVGKHGVTAKYLLDIWPNYSGAANDDRLLAVRRCLKRRLWAWGLD
jgi:hypothetical protein